MFFTVADYNCKKVKNADEVAEKKKDDCSASCTAGAKMEFIKTGQVSEQFKIKLSYVCVFGEVESESLYLYIILIYRTCAVIRCK